MHDGAKMKITRQDSNESYNITVDWIKDFAKNLETSNLNKQADHLDNIKRMVNRRKDFATIEEKMADIKSRVGFTIIKETSEENTNVKSASSCACDDFASSCSCSAKPKCECGGTCSNCTSATNRTSEIISMLRVIMEYVRDLAQDRPEIGADAMIAHLREQPKLELNKIEDKIDPVKFKERIGKILNKHKKRTDVVKYNPEESMSEMHTSNDVADYVSHANTGTQ